MPRGLVLPATLSFLILSSAALSSAQATTIFVGEPAPLDRTEYETVDDSDGFVLARVAGSYGWSVRLEVEEAIKGDPGKTLWLPGCAAGPRQRPSSHCEYREGARYGIFLVREEDGWTIPDFGFSVEVKPGDEEEWFGALRLFAGISALGDDEMEEAALRELREAALAEPERYPAKLVRMIDLHFGRPSTSKPFSHLLDLYGSAWNDRERQEVLLTLRHGRHVETSGFFRGLLLGGEPLWLLGKGKVFEWMAENPDDAPLMRDMARVWLAHPREDRTGLLELMLELAEPGDAPLLWSLVPSASLHEKRELVPWVLRHAAPGSLRLPTDEAARRDLLLLWIDDRDPRLEALLRQGEVRDWRSVRRIKKLADARRAREDVAVIWRLLRGASDGEADVLLQWAAHLDPPRALLVEGYRGASGDEQRNRALWLLFAVAVDDEIGALLSQAGAVGEGAARLERVVRAFRTCPNAAVRSLIAFHVGHGLAEARDLPAVLGILEGASLAEARELAPWLIENPAPEARALLWRLPMPSLYEERQLAEALSAAGDVEVLDMAVELRRRLMTEDDPWSLLILSRSPLPASEEEARLILAEGGDGLLQLVWVLGEEDGATPWREWFLEEVAQSEAVDGNVRQTALSYLAKLSEPEP